MESEEFRKRALECFRGAQEAVTVRARAEWLNLAQFWHQLAQAAERRADYQGQLPEERASHRWRR